MRAIPHISACLIQDRGRGGGALWDQRGCGVSGLEGFSVSDRAASSPSPHGKRYPETRTNPVREQLNPGVCGSTGCSWQRNNKKEETKLEKKGEKRKVLSTNHGTALCITGEKHGVRSLRVKQSSVSLSAVPH